MYLKVIDNGFGESVEKFVFIEEELLKELSCNFIYCFKQLLKRENINNIKELKRKPKDIERELNFNAWVYKTNYKLYDYLGHNYNYDYEKDILIIQDYFTNK